VASSDPFAVSTSSGPYVFVRGGDNATWYRRFAGGTWTAWDSLGGATLAGPIAAFDSSTGLFVFVIGTDGALYYQRFASTWSGWQRLGGDFAPVRGGR
jgi:hypothetical protein